MEYIIYIIIAIVAIHWFFFKKEKDNSFRTSDKVIDFVAGKPIFKDV